MPDEVQLRQALESFIASEEYYREAIASSTRAGQSGGCYAVELFPDGQYRVLWSGHIGNKYVSRGIILRIPTLPDEVDTEDGEEWQEALSFHATEAAEQLRNKLQYALDKAAPI